MNRSADSLRDRWLRLAQSPWCMVAVALLIRLVAMRFLFERQLDPARDHFLFGYETGRIARSIASGNGFSSPYMEPSGPTALIAPVYPYLLAGIFKLFGVYSAASAIVILSLNNLFSALTCAPLFLIARKEFGLRVAMWAGWSWAFFPYAIGLSNLWIWETSLTVLLFTCILLATLRLEQTRRPAAWIGYGVLWGVAALTSPSVLSCLPLLSAWLWYRHWRQKTICPGPMLASALIFLACVSVWLVRDYRTFGEFLLVRSNFAMEFRVGNNDDSATPESEEILPPDNPAEMQKYLRLGEIAYMAEKQQEVREFLRQHPGRFAGLTLRRIVYAWTGMWDAHPRWQWDDEGGVPNILFCSAVSLLAFLGCYRAWQAGVSCAIPLAIVLLCFPLVYYITHADVRYRHPIDPAIVLLAVYGAFGIFRAGEPVLRVYAEGGSARAKLSNL